MTRRPIAFALSLFLCGCNSSSKPVREPGEPAARQGAALAYDAARHELLLFGGATNASARNDLWAWNGSWALLSEGGPSPRQDASLVYDSARRRVVLFGGERRTASSTEIFDDTWEWDGAAWTLAAAHGPGVRRIPGACFDSTRSATLVYGGVGAQGEQLSDLWSWNGLSWTRVNVLGVPSRSHCALQLDGVVPAPELLCADTTAAGEHDGAFAHDFWSWDGSRWDSVGVAPDLSLERRWVTMPRVDRGVIFDRDGAVYVDAIGGIADPGPGARSGFALAYDSDGDRVMLFGGVRNGEPLGDLWALSDGAWTQR